MQWQGGAGLFGLHTGRLYADTVHVCISEWQYYGYLLLYIQASMADDLPVFSPTPQASGVTTRYPRCSRLIGGTVWWQSACCCWYVRNG